MLRLEPCIPPLWARSGHAQTIAGHLLPSKMLRSKGLRVELKLDGAEGDRLVFFVQSGTTSTVVYVFHGLAGSSDSSYMHRTSQVAQKLGHTVVLVNHRGCGEGAGLARAPYHSGRAEDLSAVIDWGRKHFPTHQHLAVGFSMSANALLLLGARQRGSILPDALIAVNAPVSLEDSALRLHKGLNRIYDRKFLRDCKRDVLVAHPKTDRLNNLNWRSTLYDFDQAYTAAAGGFASREDYYGTCSALPYLSGIEVPAVVLSAEDDPFVPASHYKKAQPSPNMIIHLEKVGGHMGYLSAARTPMGTRRWQDYAVREALLLLGSRGMQRGRP